MLNRANSMSYTQWPNWLLYTPGWLYHSSPQRLGAGVLSLSVLMIRGARVTCGGRALVAADKGNDPPRTGRGLSQAWVRGPVVHRLALHPCSERRQERWISRTARSSSVPGVGKERALGHGPEPGRAEDLRQGPAQRRGPAARGLPAPGAGGGRSACHHQGPWPWQWPRTWAPPWATCPDCP